MNNDPLTLGEILGLLPLRQRLQEARLAVRGDAYTPPTRADLSTLGILKPRLALQLWRGQRPQGRRVPVYNLFNRTPSAEADGWSVRKHQSRDYRGGDLTYDSHNATDFATPPGTVVVAAAPARVVLVVSEYNRGGLKILLDHGAGLMTTAVHLARALVSAGEVVARGQPIALSGASGLNFVAALFSDPPHLHFGTWLDGVPVDPFAQVGESALWLTGNDPSPHRGPADAPVPPSNFAPERVAALIDSCRDPDLAARLAAIADLDLRAGHAVFAANYYPTRFTAKINVYAHTHARTPRLDLPFAADDYDGCVME